MRWFAVLILTISAPSLAQNRATVRLTGTVQEMVSVRFHGDRTVGSDVTGRNGKSQDNALDYTLDLGEVSVQPTRDNGMRGGVVDLILRSNTSYVLTATVTGTGFGTTDDEFKLSDIGFGMPAAAIAPSGDRARNDGTQLMDGRFDADPLAARVENGAPAFAATLEDLQGGVPVLRGERISLGGSLSSPNNGLIVSTRYAVLPQFFRGNTRFEATVVYTMSSP